MDPKASALLVELEKIFPGGRVEYQFANELHKFHLERDGPSHWLYVERTFVEDHTEQELVASLAHNGISQTFQASQHSLWLALGERGVRKVDDRYGRGR